MKSSFAETGPVRTDTVSFFMKDKKMNQILLETAQNLNSMGFHAEVFDTGAQAAQRAVSLIGKQSAGFGGSDTVESLGIYEALESQGNTLYWKRKLPAERHDWARRRAMEADWYLLSANALTVTGKIINVDGHGNRVAASVYGPKRVIYIVGRNKVVAGTLEDGLRRAHQEACSVIARRKDRRTPCAQNGACVDCKSPDRCCRATIIVEKPMTMGQQVYVLLVDEALGV